MLFTKPAPAVRLVQSGGEPVASQIRIDEQSPQGEGPVLESRLFKTRPLIDTCEIG